MAPEGKHLCRRHTTGAIKRPEGGKGCASQSTRVKCTPVLTFENVPECVFDLRPLPGNLSHCPNPHQTAQGIVARHWRTQLDCGPPSDIALPCAVYSPHNLAAEHRRSMVLAKANDLYASWRPPPVAQHTLDIVPDDRVQVIPAARAASQNVFPRPTWIHRSPSGSLTWRLLTFLSETVLLYR